MDAPADVTYAIVDALTAQRPAIVRPFLDSTGRIAEIEERTAYASRQQLDINETALEEWIAESEKSLSELVRAVRDHADTVTQSHLEMLDRGIDKIEAEALEYASSAAKWQKRLEQLEKRLRPSSAKLADSLADARRRTNVMDAKYVEARLNAACVFRAVKAEFTPDNRIDMSASNEAELEGMFKALLAG